jgi:endonuclease YncB( thermonuclease family)
LWTGKILDTETPGLRPTGITQAALADVRSSAVTEWWFDPHRVTSWGPLQDQAELSDYGQVQGRHLEDRSSWNRVLAEEYKVTGGRGLIENLKPRQGWIANQLENHWGHMTGRQTPEQRGAQLAALGLQPQVVQRSIRGFFANEFLDHLAGGDTLWIANAPFEASQVGAVMAGEKNVEALNKFKSAFETQTSVPSQLYVTGAEVQTARARAQVSGDWTQVWRAYVENPVKPGTVGVRDIQDVTRAMMSYGQQLGWLGGKDVYWGTSIDFQYKLDHALTEGPAGMLAQEAHTAAEDAAVAEKRVLRQHLENTWALREVAEDTPKGRELMAQAQQGQGPIARVRNLFNMMESARPALERKGLVQRYERASLDFIEKGKTKLTTSRTLVPDGRTVKVHGGTEAKTDRVNYNYQYVSKYDDVSQVLKSQGKHAPELIDEIAGQFAKALEESPTEDTVKALSASLGTMADQEATVMAMTGSKGPRVSIPSQSAAGVASQASTSMGPRGPVARNVFKRVAPVWALGATALAATGAAVSYFQPERIRGETQEPNLLSPTYYDWAARQEYEDATMVTPAKPRKAGIPGRGFPDRATAEARWNRWDGMAHGGIAGKTRSSNTDFGSPYQGPVVSSQVVVSQDQAHKRETWMLNQYGIRRFSANDRDFWDGFFSWKRAMTSPLPRGYNFFTGGTDVQPGTYETIQTKGKNLKEINLSQSDYEFDAEDADTINIRRKGFINSVKSFMGFGEEYAVRIAGVDAPEIQHGDKQGQPWGEMAQQMAADILSKGDVTLIYDPDENTYGRSLGTLMVDGKNYSHELVKHGAASFLPFGKAEDSMIAFEGLEAVEDRAHAAGRGMWSTPYFDVIRQFDPDRQITNQTFVHEQRQASSLYVLSAESLARQAQSSGQFTNFGPAVQEARMGFNYKFAGSASKDGDKVRPGRLDAVAEPGDSVFLQQSRQAAGLQIIRSTRVQSQSQNANPYGKIAAYQSLDSQGLSTNPFSRRAYEAEAKYEAAEANRRWRQERMGEDQNQALKVLYDHQVNHHRMGT